MNLIKREHLKPLLVGALGATTVLLATGLIYVCLIIWARAYNGQAAMECLRNPVCFGQVVDAWQKAGKQPAQPAQGPPPAK